MSIKTKGAICMNGTEGFSGAVKRSFFELDSDDIDVEKICREFSEDQEPPEAFLVASNSMATQLLGVSLAFLEQGQLIPCPGMPLVGAAFDPTWGFAEAVIERHGGGLTDFRAPISRYDMGEHGDTYGYRLCPIDVGQIPEAIGQLAQIRAELDKARCKPKRVSVERVTVSRL